MLPLTGKISWFGGPNDPSAQGTPASGIPITTPGIAVYDHATLGGWWLVTLPNGTRAVLRQTDLGPAPSTGRKIDFTYSALPALGYSEHTFPTDAAITARYLGKQVPASLAHLTIAAPGSAPTTAPTAARGPADPAPAAGGNPLAQHSSGASRALLTVGLTGAGAVMTYLGLARALGVQHPLRTPARAASAIGVAA